MSLFDDVKRNLIEWYNVTSEKTSEVARVTSRRYDKFGISRDIERQFGELGSLVYNGLQEQRDDILTDPAVLVLVERLHDLEGELHAKDDEIEAIRQTHAERRTAASAGTVDVIIQEPVLEEGTGESAILMEEGPDTAENATEEPPGPSDSR